jgi:hypothetical protein
MNHYNISEYIFYCLLILFTFPFQFVNIDRFDLLKDNNSSQSTHWKTVRLFISSTFTDMQSESIILILIIIINLFSRIF